MNSLGGFFCVLLVMVVILAVGVTYGVTKSYYLDDFYTRDKLEFDRRVIVNGDTLYVYKLRGKYYE